MALPGPIVGDVGTAINCNCGTVITGYSSTVIRVKKPNGSVVVWSGTVTNVTSGIVTYTVASGDFNLAGVYTVYPDVSFSNGNRFQGMAQQFEVYNTFD